jgi:hypothetical protein
LSTIRPATLGSWFHVDVVHTDAQQMNIRGTTGLETTIRPLYYAIDSIAESGETVCVYNTHTAILHAWSSSHQGLAHRRFTALQSTPTYGLAAQQHQRLSHIQSVHTVTLRMQVAFCSQLGQADQARVAV